ncbi:hypothetical protein [Chitinophaga pinensis]|uniref:hypothetical protein n=1 Tax=Chitinophaga pinensis TaxID=79329 RepID=UPI00019E41C4|nr:hypothetical protein [Chitinophaga pinensis]
MFLDLNSSTTIAETLGDKRYHAFLKDIFTDITNPILDKKGEIYQYVSDEVIVAWPFRRTNFRSDQTKRKTKRNATGRCEMEKLNPAYCLLSALPLLIRFSDFLQD